MIAQPTCPRFIDSTHGQKQLCTMLAIQQADHVVSCIKTGEGIVMAVKFSLPPRLGFSEDEKLSLPPNSKVTIKLWTSDAESVIEASGVTIDNDYALSHADITILVMDRDVESLRASASWYSKHGLKMGKRYCCQLHS